MKRVNIKGINIYPFVSQQQIIEYANKEHGILIAINAEKIVNATEQTRAIINRNIGYCDGSGPLLCLRSMGYKDAIKVAGCELWLSIIAKYYREKTFYFVGGRQQIIDETIAKLKEQFKGINIVGYRNGYISSAADRLNLIEDVAQKKPDVVFVAMGSPKQELLMEDMLKHHSNAIYQGLGGSFDVYTGHVKRAPRWWVTHHLEWAYRLMHQPSRIKRQAKLVKFMGWIMQQKLHPHPIEG